MNTLFQDLKFGLRMLAKNPGFTAAAVLNLALGIGATTAIFSVVYGVLLRPLPFTKAHQIVSVRELSAQGHEMNFTDPNFDDLRAANRSLSGMAEYNSGIETVLAGAEPARVGVAFVSRDFFRVMGASPVEGRGFAEEDLHQGAAPVAIVGNAYWKQHLHGTSDLASAHLKLEGQVASVVGVLPAGFSFPDDTDVWIPRELREHLSSRTAHNWHVAGRIRDGVSLAQVRSDLSGIARRLKDQYGSDIDMVDASVVPLAESITRQVRPALLILLAAVGFLLLVACANVANLLLAKALARERELAIRTALGAGRSRLIRQFLAESSLLALAGGTLGVLLAAWGVDALIALAPPGLPRLGEVSMNGWVLGFVLGVSALVAMGLGIFTALRATSSDLRGGLVEGQRAGSSSPRTQRLGRTLVAGQLAITLVLLVGASLLGRSLWRVLATDTGFQTEHIATMEFQLPASQGAGSLTRQFGLVDGLFSRLRGLPNVEEIGGSTVLPLASDVYGGTFLILNRQSDITTLDDFERLVHTAPTGQADYCMASEGYFRALGIPLLRGRFFDDRDGPEAPHVTLISQSLAQATWPGQDPLGKTIEFGNMDGDIRLMTIVGVVGDVRDRSLETAPRPTVYVNYRQRLLEGSEFTVAMRTAGPPATALAAARDILRNLDPEVVPEVRTFQQVVERSLQTRRFSLTLAAVFAAAALLLATAGVYGVMAYWAERRTREIGIRMALGASRPEVLRMILGEGLKLAAIGVAGGLVGAVALTRFMTSLLYEVRALDPVALGAGIAALTAAALLAVYIPARRATKVDPMEALRYE
jgi:predicted permease